MVNVVPTYLKVRSDEVLERAIASEIGDTVEEVLTPALLKALSTEYAPAKDKEENKDKD